MAGTPVAGVFRRQQLSRVASDKSHYCLAFLGHCALQSFYNQPSQQPAQAALLEQSLQVLQMRIIGVQEFEGNTIGCEGKN